MKVKMKVAQSCLILCNLMDCIVHGILQARILKWGAIPFCRRSFQLRDWTQFSHIAGRFFTSWATRDGQEYWSGEPIPSPEDLPNPGIKLGSPALQANSLPTELWGKCIFMIWVTSEQQGQQWLDKNNSPLVSEGAIVGGDIICFMVF